MTIKMFSVNLVATSYDKANARLGLAETQGVLNSLKSEMAADPKSQSDDRDLNKRDVDTR